MDSTAEPAAQTPAVELAPLLKRLMERAGRGAKLGLEPMQAALTQLGQPQEALAVVHIAGTNGKGSVAACVEAMARADGLRTGFYSSPHLERLNERIRIDGEPIADAALARALAGALAEDLPRLSFFECLTLASLLAMRDHRCELAILEVGLGGRLDATNVVRQPRCTAITSIALDHCHVLGSDLASIAGEKAGILRPGVPLVLGPLQPEACERVAEVCNQLGGIEVWRVARDRDDGERAQRRFGFEPVECAPTGIPVASTGMSTTPLEVRLPTGERYRGPFALAGAHQRDNAAVAVAVAARLRQPTIPQRAIEEGLATVRWPGRLERLGRRDGLAEVLLDAAHNPAGARALVQAMDGRDPRRTVLVFGSMADKPWQQLLTILAPLATRRVYCRPLQPIAGRHAAEPQELAALHPGEACDRPEEALAQALANSTADDLLLVCGSIFLVGAVRAAWRGDVQQLAVPL